MRRFVDENKLDCFSLSFSPVSNICNVLKIIQNQHLFTFWSYVFEAGRTETQRNGSRKPTVYGFNFPSCNIFQVHKVLSLLASPATSPEKQLIIIHTCTTHTSSTQHFLQKKWVTCQVWRVYVHGNGVLCIKFEANGVEELHTIVHIWKR